MIAVCFLLITSCWGNFFHLKSKGKIDQLVEHYRNYTKTNSINLDQIKVREMIMYFTSSPEELQEPFRMNLSGRFSFIHLLFGFKNEFNEKNCFYTLGFIVFDGFLQSQNLISN